MLVIDGSQCVLLRRHSAIQEERLARAAVNAHALGAPQPLNAHVNGDVEWIGAVAPRLKERKCGRAASGLLGRSLGRAHRRLIPLAAPCERGDKGPFARIGVASDLNIGVGTPIRNGWSANRAHLDCMAVARFHAHISAFCGCAFGRRAKTQHKARATRRGIIHNNKLSGGTHATSWVVMMAAARSHRLWWRGSPAFVLLGYAIMSDSACAVLLASFQTSQRQYLRPTVSRAIACAGRSTQIGSPGCCQLRIVLEQKEVGNAAQRNIGASQLSPTDRARSIVTVAKDLPALDGAQRLMHRVASRAWAGVAAGTPAWVGTRDNCQMSRSGLLRPLDIWALQARP